MRKTLLAVAVALLCSVGASAQGTRTHPFTGVANDVAISNIGSGIAYHTLGWNPAVTVLTCAGKLQQSVNGTVWTDLIASMNCAVPGTSAVTAGSVNYVRMIVTSFTGTGTVYGIWRGYTTSPTAGAPGGATGTIQYNNGGAFGGVTGLTNGLAANCDGFGTPCALKFVQPVGAPFLWAMNPVGGPAGSYGGGVVNSGGGFVTNGLDAWDGTNYTTLTVSSNPLRGVFGSPLMSSLIYKTCVDAACGQDYADTGSIRSANNQVVMCAEVNPAGTDSCLTLADTGNNAVLSGANSFSSNQLRSTVATGTAPLVVASTTLVTNLHAATADAATTVTGLTPTSCTNQFVTAISASGSGTCTTDTLASAQHANQGTTTTLLHGNGAGNPAFSAVVSADMNITTTSCTNQFVTAISAGAVGTCTTDTLASAQHANQGTTTTVLHGNAAGNPSFGAVALATDVSGQLPIAAVGSAGLSATSPLAIAATGAMTCTTCTTTIASGTLALATGAITSGTCTTAQTATATGTASTDTVMADFNADPTAVTGYTPAITGMLTIIKYPTTNTFNVKVCNLTAASITPGAITLNFRVVR